MEIKWFMVKFIVKGRAEWFPYSEDEIQWVVDEPGYVSHSEIPSDGS